MISKTKNIFVIIQNKILNNRFMQFCIQTYKTYTLLIDVLLILLFKFSFDVIYLLTISPIYAYSGFTTDISILRYIISFITVFIFSLPIVGLYRQKTPSSIIVLILNLIYFIPLTSLYAFMDFSIIFYIYSLIYWALIMILQYKIPVLTIKKFNNTKISHYLFFACIFIVSFAVIYVSWKYTGFRITLDFINVYDNRAEAAEYVLPSFISYLISFSGIALPVFALYTLKFKKWFLFIPICIIFILGYSIATHKSTFFIFFLAIAAYFIYKQIYAKLFSVGLTLLSFLCLTIYFIYDNYIIIALIFNRIMSLPVKLSNDNYHFFSENNYNIFRSGILDNFGFEAIYDYSIPKIIGEYTEGYMSTNANNGLLGDVYANIGIIGIFVMPIIVIVILRLLDSVSSKLDMKIVITACIYYSLAFVNASWSTILLTHGFLFTCLLFYFFPNDKSEVSKNE